MEKINLHKPEAANDNIESPEKKLERLEAALQKSFLEAQSRGGTAGPEDDDLRTEYKDLLLDNPELLRKVFARTEKSNNPFEIQLYKMALDVARWEKEESMILGSNI